MKHPKLFCWLLLCALATIPDPLSAQTLGSSLGENSSLSIHPPVSECDFCMGSQGISPLEMGHTGARYDVRYLHLSRPYADGVEQANSAGVSETHFTQQLTLLYHIVNDLSISAMLPYSTRTASSTMGELDPETGITGEPEHSSTSGLADIILLARLNLITDHSIAGTAIAAISGGIKLPTGATSARSNSGEPLEADLQLGTGSTDWIAGVSGLVAWERFSIATNLSAILTGRGANNHSYGNNLSYDLTGRFRVYPADIDFPAFFGTLGIVGEVRGHEQEFDPERGWTPDENSGGSITYLAPGAQIFFSPSLSFEGSVQMPMLHSLNGEQLGETLRVMSGLQLMF